MTLVATSVDESPGPDVARNRSSVTAQCLPTVSAADFWREIPFAPKLFRKSTVLAFSLDVFGVQS
jgi:hypothetical protein